jgi:hypothetical protein
MKYSQWHFDSMSFFANVDDTNMEKVGFPSIFFYFWAFNDVAPGNFTSLK